MPCLQNSEWGTALSYAISSLKTDEAYQIMYEGGEIYTKAEVIDILEVLKQRIEDIPGDGYHDRAIYQIQEKINFLRGNEDDRN